MVIFVYLELWVGCMSPEAFARRLRWMLTKFPVQYFKIKSAYDSAEDRARLASVYPWVMGAIRLLATGISVIAYFREPPFGGVC